MEISTTTEAILRGDISIYLAANDNSVGTMFGGRINNPLSPITILMVTDSLRWGYDDNSGANTTSSLREVTNYLIWLIGVYGQQAQAIIDGGGGGTVIPPSSLGLPYDWVITGATSDTEPLKAGDISVILTKFIGYNVEFTRSNLTQNTSVPPDGFSTYYSWNRATGLFTLRADIDPFGAATLGEQFRILPTR